MFGIHKRETLFYDLCESNTGRVLSNVQWENLVEQRSEILTQSHYLAGVLESAGESAYTTSNYGLYRVSLHSRKIEKLPDFRKINFLPSVAQANRSKVLKHLQYWIEKNPFDRFWTFTSGGRCYVGELRDRLRWLHRKISKLNHEDFMQSSGVSIVFRSSEIGSTKYDSDNIGTFHPHTHCIVHLEKKLSKENWTELITKVRKYVDRHFDDSGAIDKAREACKYVAKPTDLMDLSGIELKLLYNALKRLHLVQPMRGFKDHLQMMKDNKLKLTKPDGKWTFQPNWNAHEKKERESFPDCPRPSNLDAIPEAENVVVSRLAPAAYSYPITEPAVIVRNLRDVEAIFNNPLVDNARRASEAAWKSGVSIYVHTYSINCPAEPDMKKAEKCEFSGFPLFP